MGASLDWPALLPIAILLAAAFGGIRFADSVDDNRAWWFG